MLPVWFSELLFGTMITGEEELLKRSCMMKIIQDFTVIRWFNLCFIVTIKAMNKVRVGEEQEISNLMDYLNTQTIRE